MRIYMGDDSATLYSFYLTNTRIVQIEEAKTAPSVCACCRSVSDNLCHFPSFFFLLKYVQSG